MKMIGIYFYLHIVFINLIEDFLNLFTEKMIELLEMF